MALVLLNIGCGRNFHPAWVNIDIAPVSSEIVRFDILKRLPFPDNHFDAVYHSHLIEHLEPETVHRFLKDVYRVLKPKGFMRVVTPDLETIARLYLEKLAAAREGVAGASLDYEWIVLELFDQVARNVPGGEMQKFLLQPAAGNSEFIFSRIGSEFKRLQNSPDLIPKSMLNGIRQFTFRSITKYIREKMASLSTRIIAGKDAGKSFEAGLFRHSGEVHYKLYDRYSLSVLLEKAGFFDLRTCQPNESSIPDFANYALDVNNGLVRKPDSLFMEGIKP